MIAFFPPLAKALFSQNRKNQFLGPRFRRTPFRPIRFAGASTKEKLMRSSSSPCSETRSLRKPHSQCRLLPISRQMPSCRHLLACSAKVPLRNSFQTGKLPSALRRTILEPHVHLHRFTVAVRSQVWMGPCRDERSSSPKTRSIKPDQRSRTSVITEPIATLRSPGVRPAN